MRNIYKKSIPALISALCAGGAYANTGQVLFTGTISSTTCDFTVEVEGTANASNVVNIGDYDLPTAQGEVTANGVNQVFGSAVDFKLVPNSSVASCKDVTTKSARISIASGSVASTNSDVLTAAVNQTQVGIRVLLWDSANEVSVINQGPMTLDSSKLDGRGAVMFRAQPYALAQTIGAGVLGGSLSYTITYL